MKVSIMRGNQVICSSSDEQMTMEDVNAIRRKERMTDRKSTLSVYVYDPNKDPKPIKLPQNTEKIIEDAKLVAEGKVPGKTVVMDTMPEEVREAEEKEDESVVEESSEEETPVMTSGYVSVGDEAVDPDDIGFTTVASTDDEVVDECNSDVEPSTDEDFVHQKEEAKAEAAIELGKESETKESSEEEPEDVEGEENVEEDIKVENTTEFNVQSKFTQPTTEEPSVSSDVEANTVEETIDETSDEEDETEETPVEEVINRPSASSKVIDDFFAKEAREAKMYGNKGNKNFKQQRNRGGKGRRIEEY